MKKKDEDIPTVGVGQTGLPSLGGFDSEQTSTRHTETIAVMSRGLAAERPVLVIVKGIDAGRVISIGHGEMTIGRAEESVLALPDRGVSQRHARIVRAEPGRHAPEASDIFVIEDLGSKNGTFVDGVAIERPRQLAVGESFQIGPDVVVRLTVMSDAAEKAARQLYVSSMHDPLTLAFNFRYMARCLKSELAYAARHQTPLSAMVLNFDHFKAINDEHGQGAGDVILQRLTKVVHGVLRTEDVLGRLDAEHFVALLRGIDEKGALACAERVRVAVASELLPTDPPCRVTVSVGVSTNTESDTTGERLFELATARLSLAKSQGRDQVCGPAAGPRSSSAPKA